MNNSQIDALDFFKKRKFITKISNNDTISSVKRIVFIKYPGLISPEIMALGDSKKYISSMKKSIQVIYVYNLIDELTKYIFDNISIFLDINNTSAIIDELFNSLKEVYTDLTQDHLVLVIKYILYKNAGFSDFKREVENFEKSIDDLRTKLISEKIDDKNKFKKGDGKGIFAVDNIGNYIYSLINCIVSVKFEDSIDLSRVLKGITVSERIPVMGMDKVGIKILKGFPKKIAEDWIFTRSKSGELKPKLLKGLTLKVKSDNFSSDPYYYTVILSDNSKSLVTRLNWKKNDFVTFEDIKSYIKEGLSEVIDKINKVEHNLDIKKFDYSKISYSVIQVNTTKNFNLLKISLAIDDFGDIFKKEENSGRFLRLKYDETEENITIVIKNSNYIADGIEYKNNVVEFLNVTPFTNLQKIIDQIGSLLLKSESKRLLEFRNSKLVEIKQVKESGKKVKETIGTKVLKEAGAGINSISCQKKRQPTLYTKDDSIDTYALDYKGNKYICKNKENGYIYPGFTSQKSPCCFTKDQRSKEIYKNMASTSGEKSEELIVTSDSYIISKTRIIHNLKGVVLSNRIGVLPNVISNVFGGGDQIYKLGVAHDFFTLLNVFNRATSKNIKPEKINAFMNKYNATTYTKLNSLKILEYLEFYFKINAVIIDLENEKFLCNKITGLLYPETIFILKRENFSYELLVEKINSKTLKKTFAKNDTIFKKFLINYNKSCIVNYSGTTVVPYSVPEMIDRGYSITGQIVNAFDKIIYLVLPDLGMIPVIPYNRLPGLKVVNTLESRLDAISQYNKLKNTGIEYLKIKGISRNTENLVDGLVTFSNIIIPVLPSKGSFKDLPVIFYGYYGVSIDNVLAQNTEPTTNDYYSLKNLETFYYKELYYRLKYTCSKIFSENKDLKQLISKTNSKSEFLKVLLRPEVIFYKETKITDKARYLTRKVCSKIPVEICAKDAFCGNDALKTKCLLRISEPLFSSFIKRICIEMKWNKDILSGNVKKEDVGKNDFPTRKNEIVLVNPQDFEKFFV